MGQALETVAEPDRIDPVECAGCHNSLASAVDAGLRAGTAFDIPLIEQQVTELHLARRRWACGTVTAAPAPAGVYGPTCYGPNLRALTTLLAADGQISTERTAKLIEGLLNIPVSTGFVDRST